MNQPPFSELQDALENIVIALRVAKDARERKEPLHLMSKLIEEAAAVLEEQPLKAFKAGASD